jgi:hypothetical protein
MQAQLDDLESTHYAPVAVNAAPLTDLETTESVLGDVRLPADDSSYGPASCPACGAPAAGKRFCESCGFALHAAARENPAPEVLRCPACGIVNRPQASRCRACGERLRS